MKYPLIFAILAIFSNASAESTEHFILVSANATIAGESYSTPRALSDQDKEVLFRTPSANQKLFSILSLQL